MKKILSLIFAICLTVSITACNSNSNITTSANSNLNESQIKYFSIGELDFSEVSVRLNAISLKNNYRILPKENTDTSSNQKLLYAVNDLEGKEVINIEASANSENKALGFTVSWKYDDYNDDINRIFIDLAKSIIIAAWPDYSEENLELLSQYLVFTLDEVKYLENKNKMIVAPATTGSIFIEMFNGYLTYGIKYPHIVTDF